MLFWMAKTGHLSKVACDFYGAYLLEGKREAKNKQISTRDGKGYQEK